MESQLIKLLVLDERKFIELFGLISSWNMEAWIEMFALGLVFEFSVDHKINSRWFHKIKFFQNYFADNWQLQLSCSQLFFKIVKLRYRQKILCRKLLTKILSAKKQVFNYEDYERLLNEYFLIIKMNPIFCLISDFLLLFGDSGIAGDCSHVEPHRDFVQVMQAYEWGQKASCYGHSMDGWAGEAGDDQTDNYFGEPARLESSSENQLLEIWCCLQCEIIDKNVHQCQLHNVYRQQKNEEPRSDHSGE